MALPTSLALSSCVIRADDVHPVVLVPHHPFVHVDDVVRVGDLEAGGGKWLAMIMSVVMAVMVVVPVIMMVVVPVIMMTMVTIISHMEFVVFQ